MSKPNRAIEEIIKAMRAHGERSPLFWWFVDHHDEFREGASRQRLSWLIVASEVTALGLTNRKGEAPTPKLTKLTWQRARQFVAKRAAAVTTPVRVSAPVTMPSRVDVQPRLAQTIDHEVPPEPFPYQAPTHAVVAAIAAGPGAAQATDSPLPPQALPILKSSAVVRADLPPPAPGEPEWTPEQIAHRDAQLAKVRASLDHMDRFIGL